MTQQTTHNGGIRIAVVRDLCHFIGSSRILWLVAALQGAGRTVWLSPPSQSEWGLDDAVQAMTILM